MRSLLNFYLIFLFFFSKVDDFLSAMMICYVIMKLCNFEENSCKNTLRLLHSPISVAFLANKRLFLEWNERVFV